MPLPLHQKSTLPHINSLDKIKSIIAIAAGKGGVGKSSVTVQLAFALQAQGYQVGIIDADVYGPSIRKMLPEDQFPIQKDAVIQPALCSGIKMISMAYLHKEKEANAIRAPMANNVILHFIKNVQWGELDFLLIDFPPGTGDIQLTLSQQAHLTGAVMVTTPQEIALIDVRKALSLFEKVKIPILGIVENMSYYQPSKQIDPVYIFGHGGGERLALETGNPFLGSIPLDPSICSCGDKGESLLTLDPEVSKPATYAFQHIAQQLITQLSQLKIEHAKGLTSFELIWKEMNG